MVTAKRRIKDVITHETDDAEKSTLSHAQKMFVRGRHNLSLSAQEILIGWWHRQMEVYWNTGYHPSSCALGTQETQESLRALISQQKEYQ